MLRKKTNTNKSNLTTAATSARPKMITAHRAEAEETQTEMIKAVAATPVAREIGDET